MTDTGKRKAAGNDVGENVLRRALRDGKASRRMGPGPGWFGVEKDSSWRDEPGRADPRRDRAAAAAGARAAARRRVPVMKRDRAAVAPLIEARDETEIVAACAAIVRRELTDSGKPPRRNSDPDMRDLAAYFYLLPRRRVEEATRLFTDLLLEDYEIAVVQPALTPVVGAFRGEPRLQWQIDDYVESLDDYVLIESVTGGWPKARDAWARRGEADGWFADFPLLQLMFALFEVKPPRVANRRAKTIAPESLARLRLAGRAEGARAGRRLEPWTPQMELMFNSSPVPALPFNIARGTGRRDGLADALALEILQATPRRSRRGLADVTITLGRMIEWLFPDWRPRRDMQRLRQALKAVNEAEFTMGADVGGGARMIAIANPPQIGARRDWPTYCTIAYASNSDRGPQIENPEVMRRLRTSNLVAWRALWRLVYLWDAAEKRARHRARTDRNPERRIYATAPDGGQNRWAAEVPALTPDDVVRLGFDDADVARPLWRRRLHKTKAALSELESAGLIEIRRLTERDDDGVPKRRILRKRPGEAVENTLIG